MRYTWILVRFLLFWFSSNNAAGAESVWITRLKGKTNSSSVLHVKWTRSRSPAGYLSSKICCFFKLHRVETNHIPPVPKITNCVTTVPFLYTYTGRFIMFSVITNIYNNKTKGPTSMEFFTATGKLKKFFLTTRDVWCVHHEWHGTHRYDIQVLATHASTWVHRYSSELLWSVSLGQRGHVAILGRILCTKCTLHSNHRLTRVIFQHTKRLFPRSGHFLTTYTRIA